jgi:hypothetical protein
MNKCPSTMSEDGGSAGRQIPCTGVMTSDGVLGGCGEPCTFVLHGRDSMREPERGDGRKAHYGAGRQPLDDIVEQGWGPAFCAGNIVKYLRRDKQVEDSRAKAKWYWDFMVAQQFTADRAQWIDAINNLRILVLSTDETNFLTGEK